METTTEEQEKMYEEFFKYPLLAEQVALNLDHLNYRYNRLRAIDTLDPSNKEEFLMIFDSFLAISLILSWSNRKSSVSVQLQCSPILMFIPLAANSIEILLPRTVKFIKLKVF